MTFVHIIFVKNFQTSPETDAKYSWAIIGHLLKVVWMMRSSPHWNVTFANSLYKQEWLDETLFIPTLHYYWRRGDRLHQRNKQPPLILDHVFCCGDFSSGHSILRGDLDLVLVPSTVPFFLFWWFLNMRIQFQSSVVSPTVICVTSATSPEDYEHPWRLSPQPYKVSPRGKTVARWTVDGFA